MPTNMRPGAWPSRGSGADGIGCIHVVGYFESEAAAREWIATKADTYFRERKAVG